MRYLKLSLLAFLTFLTVTSCFKDNDDDIIAALPEINNFVYSGMNTFYLYKYDVPDLATNRATEPNYENYLNSFSSPEDLFESLIYQRETVDRFSWITDNYIELEQSFSGVTKSNGLKFDFYLAPGSTSEIVGVIRLVLNNSEASSLNLKRGQLFNAVDGTTLTQSNYSSLLSQDSYTLHFVDYDDNGTPETDDDSLVSNSETASLTKMVHVENPVHTTRVIDIDGEKLGYIMYNRFNDDFDSELNNAFSEFKGSNVQHLVIDLRYNPGGSVNTASLMGSMVTGQFTDDIFAKLEYNSDLQANNTNFIFKSSFNGETINSLNLDKVYVLTTERSASASELIINSLKSHINVVQIGDTTVGKSQASITVYDSPDFSAQNRNPNHTYAMQPLVAITVNKDDGIVPPGGIIPNTEIIENPLNMGILGDVNEPLLAAAIQDIQGTGRFIEAEITKFIRIENKVDVLPFETEMYID